MCGFPKNVLVKEMQLCKALSIGYHLEISSFLLMSAENTETLAFVSLMFCFLGFVHRHNELFFSYLWSFFPINSQVHDKYESELIRKERPWLILFMLRCMCVQSDMFVARVLHFSAF